jgi:hypothetical protein
MAARPSKGLKVIGLCSTASFANAAIISSMLRASTAFLKSLETFTSLPPRAVAGRASRDAQ